MNADLSKLQTCRKQVLDEFAVIDKREKEEGEAQLLRREELRASGKVSR